MSRRPSSPSVSLFPFLAVLMCALGALILLLLVTAGRIRNEAFEKAIAAEMAAVPEPVSAPPIEVIPEPISEPEPLPVDIPEPLPLPPPGPTADELRREWQEAVADLESHQAQLAAQLDSEQRALDEGRTQLAAIESEAARMQLQSAALADRQADLNSETKTRAARRAELEWELSHVNEELEAARRQRQEDQSRFRVMPYDGQSGTTRRPILIECTAGGLTFAAEGITLTPEELNGFSPIKNPLLSGVDALITYWSVQDLKGLTADERLGKPYVLLIVRPGGTVGYYVARRLLESMNEPFGYELVAEEQQFRWPDRDPQAAAACQAAIDAVLAQRTRMQSQVAGGQLPVAGPLQFSNGTGEFYLEEVEQLRSNREHTGGRQSVHVGGRTFDRTPAGAGSTSATNSTSGTGTAAGSPASNNRSSEPAGAGAGPGPRVIELPRNNSLAGAPGSPENGSGGVPAAATAAATGEPGSTTGSAAPGTQGNSSATVAAGRTGSGSRQQPVSPGSDWSTADAAAAASESWQRSSSGQDGGAGNGIAAGPASQTGRGTAGAGGEPPDPFAPNNPSGLFAQQESRIDPRAPQWGARTPGSSIGLEREVIIRVDDSQVAVARELPINITPGMTRDELQQALAETLDAHIRAWGLPPKSFYWLPMVRYQILPGGNQYLKRLTEVTDEWSVKSSTEYVLE